MNAPLRQSGAGSAGRRLLPVWVFGCVVLGGGYVWQYLQSASSSAHVDGEKNPNVLPAAQSIRALAVSDDGEYLETVRGESHWIRLDAFSGQVLNRRRIDERSGYRFSLRPEREMLAAIHSGRQLNVFSEDQSLWSDRLVDQRVDDFLYACNISRHGDRIAVGSYQGDLWIMEFDHGEVVSQRKYALGQEVHSVAVSPNGQDVAVMLSPARLILWNVEQEQVTGSRDLPNSRANLVNWSGDGSSLVTYVGSSLANVWNAPTLAPRGEFRVEALSIVSACLSDDGSRIAVGDGAAIRVWSVEDHESIAVLQGHQEDVSVVVFGDNERTLFSGDFGGELRRWSLADGRAVWSVHDAEPQ